MATIGDLVLSAEATGTALAIMAAAAIGAQELLTTDDYRESRPTTAFVTVHVGGQSVDVCGGCLSSYGLSRVTADRCWCSNCRTHVGAEL